MSGAIVEFVNHVNNTRADLSIPLTISPEELFMALNEAFMLTNGKPNANDIYLQAEYPDALLRGNRALSTFGVRDGTIIHFTPRKG